MNSFIGSLIVGGLAGWLAGFFVKKNKSGCIWNIIIGLLGGVIGGKILSWLNVDWGGGFWGSLGTALFGSVLMLWIWNKVKK